MSAQLKESPVKDKAAEKLFSAMLSAAHKISTSRNIKLPPNIDKSFDVCRAFLDQVISQPAPPTPGMRALAQRVAAEQSLELTHELTDFEACRHFLRTHVGMNEADIHSLRSRESL